MRQPKLLFHLLLSRVEPIGRRAWLVLWASVCLVLAWQVTSRALDAWFLEDRAQPGQLSIFNSQPDGGYLGMPLEMGDFDGDGRQDLVIAPMKASAGEEGDRRQAGHVYVYPGSADISGVIDRSKLEPGDERGLTLWGEREDDLLGTELARGDVDGDGIEDLIIGAQNYDGPDGDRDNAGGTYLILGRTGLLSGSPVFDLSRGPEALRRAGLPLTRITGGQSGERSGIWVESGDLDGDGKSDVLIGSSQYSRDFGDGLYVGQVTVLYGREDWPAEIDLSVEPGAVSDMSRIVGERGGDLFGASLHASDLDGDGRDELIVGAALNRLSAGVGGVSAYPAFASGGGGGPPNAEPRPGAGITYVILSPVAGRLPLHLDLSSDVPTEMRGRITRIYGAESGETAGEEIASGDFDGDGYRDLVIGALAGRGPAPEKSQFAGRCHVVYWHPSFAGTVIDLGEDGSSPWPKGLRVSTILGKNSGDILGDTLSVGDFDRDGLDDLAVGIPHADSSDGPEAGAVAIVFGSRETWPRTWVPQAAELPPRLQVQFVFGHRRGDLMSYSMEARDYDGDGYDDLFPNAMRGEFLGDDRNDDRGAAYVVSGYRLSGLSLRLDQVIPPASLAGESVEVSIRGEGFTQTADTRVWIGETEVQEILSVDRRSIVARLPILPADKLLTLRVENSYGEVELLAAFQYVASDRFLRSDTDFSGRTDISDAIKVLTYLFSGGALLCEDAADTDDDGDVDISDATAILDFLFLGGDPPAAPYPVRGSDPSPDDLSCGN